MGKHWAYYNEHDEYAAQWLRNLMEKGLIAPGFVDTRSISDVKPNDLWEYTQCHFFAGIGVWSYALRQAGWPDSRPVWTGSCPCQPFSTAGSGAGFDDERHLWPDFAWLIGQCNPTAVYGEQVASKAAQPWVDLVQDDLEEMGYAFASVPFPASSVGAPHIRDRLYWVADSADQRFDGRRPGSAGDGRDAARQQPERLRDAERLADSDGARPLSGAFARVHRREAGTGPWHGELERPSSVGGLADANSEQRPDGEPRLGDVDDSTGRHKSAAAIAGLRSDSGPGPTNGLWRDADWLFCRDGKWRPVEPGTFPLAHGAASRVGRLRAYGNALNAEAAKAFIQCVM